MSNATIACDVCLSVTGLIVAEANLTNVTVATIGKAVEVLCGIIGGSIVSKECDFLIDNIENIVSWADKGMKKMEICQKLRMCSSVVKSKFLYPASYIEILWPMLY